MRRAIGRLRSRRGETLTEVLVSTLIAAVALTMLASMVTTGARLVTQSRDRLAEYYETGNTLAAQEIAETDPETVELSLEDENGAAAHLRADEDRLEAYVFVNDALGGAGVTAYRWKE